MGKTRTANTDPVVTSKTDSVLGAARINATALIVGSILTFVVGVLTVLWRAPGAVEAAAPGAVNEAIKDAESEIKTLNEQIQNLKIIAQGKDGTLVNRVYRLGGKQGL